MNMPASVRIVEVGPRDGLQNEAVLLALEHKIQFINELSATGLTYIEAGSFVSPKWVPQMGGSADVFKGIRQSPSVTYAALTPNMKGLEAAMEVGVKEIAVFTAASESFSQRNINCSFAQSLERFASVLETALSHRVRVRGYVSCVLGCPYEGAINPEQVRSIAQELFGMGCYEVSLGDTIGVGTASSTRTLIETVGKAVAREHLAGHFHDTYGQALTNIYVSLLEGIEVFDSSVAGLGGCPYANGASGNVATEDLLYLLNGLGIYTGVDLNKVAQVGQLISQCLGRVSGSKVSLALAAAPRTT